MVAGEDLGARGGVGGLAELARCRSAEPLRSGRGECVGLAAEVVDGVAVDRDRLADLLDRAPTGGGQGFYEWAAAKDKPLMIAEWGAYHRIGHPADKAPVYDSVLPELANRPAIKAIVYFDTKRDDQGDRDISINSSASALAAFKRLAADPIFNVKIG